MQKGKDDRSVKTREKLTLYILPERIPFPLVENLVLL